MNFRSINDMNQAIVKNLYKVPDDIDLIVGVPRSGLLAANILALHLHLPLTDVSGFCDGRIISSGKRMNGRDKDFSLIKKALVLDDSLYWGTSMDEVRHKLGDCIQDVQILYSAVFMRPGYENKVDIYFEHCPEPRVFEWNLMNHPFIRKACVDIDGVLCPDPTEDENDDGVNYLKFIENAPPLLRIRQKIGYLVTNRLEKYRFQTEKWLKKNNIEYDELIMLNLPDKNTRRKVGKYGVFKGEFYKKKVDSKIFIESSYKQSLEIARISGKPVYCVDNRVMVYPNSLSAGKQTVRKIFYRINKKVHKLI